MIPTLENPELLRPSQDVEEARIRMSDSLTTISAPLAVLVGPCAPDLPNIEALQIEGESLSGYGRIVSKLRIAHGLPVQKPRSDPTSWKGMEESHPEAALKLIQHSSRNFAHTAIEVVTADNISKYAHLLTLAWTGARNENNMDLKLQLANEHQSLPLLIKNGLSGEIDLTLEQIERLRQNRDPNSAPIILLYRGGENAKTPEAWEQQYLQACELTEGKLMVDVAHGGEMAHDPTKMFNKSVLGQVACFDHTIMLAEAGYVPSGVKIEASNVPSPIDPVISLQVAVNSLRRMRLVVPNYEV
jgi:hypothetical protein